VITRFYTHPQSIGDLNRHIDTKELSFFNIVPEAIAELQGIPGTPKPQSG
jgi:3-polyprenyl-4-hydroxybenzoate decarboxylase